MGQRRVCVVCGDPLTGRGRRLYCLAHAEEERSCATCGGLFRVPRKRRGRNFVCSLACRPGRQWGQPKVVVRCGWCGTEIVAHASKPRKFCSRSCAGLGRPISGRSAIADAAIDEFLRRTPILCEREKRVGRWAIDLALPLEMIAVELDGDYWHSLPEMVEKDRRKDDHMTRLGWAVHRIPIHKQDIPAELADRIAEVLEPCRTTT